MRMFSLRTWTWRTWCTRRSLWVRNNNVLISSKTTFFLLSDGARNRLWCAYFGLFQHLEGYWVYIWSFRGMWINIFMIYAGFPWVALLYLLLSFLWSIEVRKEKKQSSKIQTTYHASDRQVLYQLSHNAHRCQRWLWSSLKQKYCGHITFLVIPVVLARSALGSKGFFCAHQKVKRMPILWCSLGDG